MYTELDLTFLGLKVPNVGVLIAEEQKRCLIKTYDKVTWNSRMEFNPGVL